MRLMANMLSAVVGPLSVAGERVMSESLEPTQSVTCEQLAQIAANGSTAVRSEKPLQDYLRCGRCRANRVGPPMCLLLIHDILSVVTLPILLGMTGVNQTIDWEDS